jgi:hypothetical protein
MAEAEPRIESVIPEVEEENFENIDIQIREKPVVTEV